MSLLLGALLIIVLLFGVVAFFGAPYVPSLRSQVRRAFTELYPVKSNDVVVDLGAGDGSVLKVASEHGAACYGVELNPLLVCISAIRLGKNGQVKHGNMWRYELPDDVTLIYVFSVSRDVKRLGEYLQEQANRLGRPLSAMTFGATLPDYTPAGVCGAHSLYTIEPLQPGKHKV